MKFSKTVILISLFTIIFYFTYAILDEFVINPNDRESEYFKKPTIITNVKFDNLSKSEEFLKLPSLISGKDINSKNREFSFHIDMEKYQVRDYSSIYLESGYMNLEVYRDNYLVYEYFKTPNNLSKMGLIEHHIIDLKNLGQVRDIEIKFKPIDGSIPSYNVLPILLGSRLSIINYMLKKDSLKAIASFVLFSIFMCMIFVYLASKNTGLNADKTLNVAVLSLICGVYFISHSWTFRFVIDGYYIPNILEYCAFVFVMPSLCSLFVYDINPKSKLAFRILFVASILNLVIQNTLASYFNIEYSRMVKFTHIIIFFYILTIIWAFLITDGKKYPQKKQLVLSMLIATLTVGSGTIYLIIYGNLEFVNYTILGAIIFVVMQAVIVLNSYKKIYNELVKENYYKEAAFIDPMTQLSSRVAYIQKLDSFKLKKILGNSLFVMSIDMNNLKSINDEFGHDMGDKYIKILAEAIDKACSLFKNAEGFRIGGDEFVCFVEGESMKECKKFKSLIDNNLEKIIQNSDKIKPSYSSGYIFKELGSEFKIDDMIIEADKLMYLDKSKSHEKVAEAFSWD